MAISPPCLPGVACSGGAENSVARSRATAPATVRSDDAPSTRPARSISQSRCRSCSASMAGRLASTEGGDMSDTSLMRFSCFSPPQDKAGGAPLPRRRRSGAPRRLPDAPGPRPLDGLRRWLCWALAAMGTALFRISFRLSRRRILSRSQSLVLLHWSISLHLAAIRMLRRGKW